MHKIGWYLLIALCLGLGGPRPTVVHRPAFDWGQRVQPKVYSISLRYRQLLQQQIDLPPMEPSRTCPMERQPAAQFVPRGAPLSPDADFLLMRIQV